MGIVNVLLIRYQGGWTTVEDATSIAAYGRIEGFLSLGAVESLDEVQRIAEATFDTLASPRFQTTVTVEPTADSDKPYVAFGIEDLISVPNESGTAEDMRVKAITVAEDAEGQVTYTPEVRDVLEDDAEKLARWLSQLANGALGGTSRSATAPIDKATGEKATLPVLEVMFSVDGTVDSGTLAPYRAWERLHFTDWSITALTAGTSATSVDLTVNGTVVASMTLGASAEEVTGSLSVDLEPGDVMTVDLDAGAAVEDLSVQVLAG